MQDFIGLHTGGGGRCVKNTNIRLADTEAVRAEAGVKVFTDADPVHIGIAVGERDQRKTRSQELQRRQGVFIEVHPHAVLEEHFKRRLGQKRVFPTLA